MVKRLNRWVKRSLKFPFKSKLFMQSWEAESFPEPETYKWKTSIYSEPKQKNLLLQFIEAQLKRIKKC